MAALGRPLYPGMLYDCRSDSFIPGVRLWDMTKLNKGLDVQHLPKKHLKFVSSDTFHDKASLLDISASLKASFLSGLVEVGGSAKFLHDTKSSEHQCRVTMQYSQTTTFEQLTITELGNITYPQVFDQKTATHVVTAVLYGAQAFMVFDYTAEDDEMKQKVDGQLNAMVKKIPNFSIDGNGAVNMTEDEKDMAENISVTFYGDYELEQNPRTFKEALEVYKMLPGLMKTENNRGVPLTVWLYPLMLLNDKAAKLEREISMRLVHKTANVLEELGEVERRCKDLVNRQTTDNFPDVKDRLLKFQELHRDYKKAFQEELSRVLPAIRSGAHENKTLGDILSNHYTSYFTTSNVNKWLEDITTELNILSSYTSGLKDLILSESFFPILFEPGTDVVVCLSFTSLKYKDSYLADMQDFVNSKGFTNLGQENANGSSFPATQPWFTTPGISRRMRENLFLFTNFYKANKIEKRIKFIIASISDDTNPGNSIRLYQNGLLTDPQFQPVSKPPPPTVEISDGTVILKLSKSPTGDTVQFRIEYRTTPLTDDDSWTVTKMSDAQTNVTLTGLKPADQYWVRYRAVSEVGVSEASDSVTFNFLQKINVKMDQLWNLFLISHCNELRTKIMTSMGMSRWSLSTMQSEVTNIVNSPKIPYIATIPRGLRAGMALYFQGVVCTTGRRFALNLVTGLTADDDIAFHFNPRFDDSVVLNTRRNGEWENEERTSENPFSKGSAFDIFIVTTTEGYEVYANGQRLTQFKHRMPMENVVSLYIFDDVIINTVGIVENWSTSTFAKELNSDFSRTKLSNIQSDVPQPVCSPSKPYLGSIPGGLRPGVALFFQGVVPSDCERFEINLQTGPVYLHDIALHFNPRMHSVVLNSCRDGTWENQIMIPGGPFVKGGAFDIIIVIKSEGYEVLVNGLHYCTFAHRIPVNKVTTLDIRGDVFMNTFRIIEDLLLPYQYNELRTKIMTSMGMSRWSLSTIKSEVTNFVNIPRIPYIATIPRGLRAGMALYFQGVVFTTGRRFALNLVTGLTVDDDIAFHFNPRFDDSVVLNSRRNGEWENEERTSENPFSKGSAFDIFIVTKTEGYEVYANGQRLTQFKHRMPMENVVSLYIYDDVIINTVGIVENWSTSTFAKELNSGISRTKLSNIQSDVPQPVCSPSKPYLGSIPGGLRPGVALFFQGVVPLDGERFDINLQTGPVHLHDFALHFNPRMDSVVLNSRRNGTWEDEIKKPGGPFVKGGAFDIIMVIKPESYEVLVNGLHYCTFDHRIPVNKVTALSIRGDVFMNTFKITEVDDLNLLLKITTPVEI